MRRPSPLGAEAEAQAYVADHLAASGLAVDVWDLDDSIKALPNAGDSGVPFPGRPNVAGIQKGSGGGRSLIVQGHIDVVSPEPVAAWSYDPWQATVVGDRMYGRGAYDMKSGDALNLMLPRLLRDLGIQLAGDLIVQSVIEEECTGNGALDAARRYHADAAVITEPTGGRFTHAHVGVLWFRIGIVGKSWHAMQAWQGVNAITKAIPIMQALQDLDARLNQQTHPAFADIEHPINLNIGVIHGGDWPSTVPGACELHCRLSCYPGQTVEETRREIETAIAGAIAGDPWFAEHPPQPDLGRFPERGLDRVDGRAVGPAPQPLARAGLRRADGAEGRHRHQRHALLQLRRDPRRVLRRGRGQRARRRRMARSALPGARGQGARCVRARLVRGASG